MKMEMTVGEKKEGGKDTFGENCGRSRCLIRGAGGSLPGTPTDSTPRVSSYLYPDIFSIAYDT
jgi:hypothetical protein